MRAEMPGQHRNLMDGKRKSCSDGRSSRKATRRKDVKRLKTSAADCQRSSNSKAVGPLERISHVTCECLQLPSRRRCSASPQLEGQEGKENEVRMAMESDRCRVHGVQDRQEETEETERGDKSIFLDDDSNQILPLEQFFGNLDAVQDFPQISSPTSLHVQRENRRRHYFAREDSEEEEAGQSGTQQDHRGGS
ncbi:hypothetical protein LDENG_00154380 [Lucifuga dentata]|nr:hypothetical protein LDENG_00154380 [Lucifuga dentata]